jgi:hypothetical protein
VLKNAGKIKYLDKNKLGPELISGYSQLLRTYMMHEHATKYSFINGKIIKYEAHHFTGYTKDYA